MTQFISTHTKPSLPVVAGPRKCGRKCRTRFRFESRSAKNWSACVCCRFQKRDTWRVVSVKQKASLENVVLEESTETNDVRFRQLSELTEEDLTILDSLSTKR